MLKEFKEFVVKGNVIDLAVAVIIGGAFGKIVSSLVNDILMPVFGVILSGINLADLKYVIKSASGDTPEVAILYGSFIQAVVDCLIIAFSIFLFIKLISSRKRKEPEAPSVPPKQEPEVMLLEEIRDLLKQNSLGIDKRQENS
jgi:large conductance mechanosensitive channel